MWVDFSRLWPIRVTGRVDQNCHIQPDACGGACSGACGGDYVIVPGLDGTGGGSDRGRLVDAAEMRPCVVDSEPGFAQLCGRAWRVDIEILQRI